MMLKISVAADTDLIWLECKMVCERSRAVATEISRLDLVPRSMLHCCLPIKNKKWKVCSNSETNVTAYWIWCNILSYSTHSNNILNVYGLVNVSHANIQGPCSNSMQIVWACHYQLVSIHHTQLLLCMKDASTVTGHSAIKAAYMLCITAQQLRYSGNVYCAIV
jgi:hypothetical protein